MGIVLTHNQVIASCPVFAPLVADDNARGNTGSAQHEGGCARIVGAKPSLLVEKQGINAVFRHGRRSERVKVFLFSKTLQQGTNELLVAHRTTKFPRKFSRSGIAFLRQLKIAAQFRSALFFGNRGFALQC